jgi:hypothetical protein
MAMRLKLAGVLGGLVLLAGCGSSTTRFPVACPKPAILGQGADLTRYRPGAPADLAGLESDAKLVRVQGGCNRGNDAIEMVLAVGFVVERGPASRARDVDLPWFVAVVDNRDQRVLSERDFIDRIVFNPNETRATRLSQQVEISLPVGEYRRPQDYTVYVSFRLSPEDLALNRQRGVR